MRRLTLAFLLAALAVLAAALDLPAPSAVGEVRQVLPALTRHPDAPLQQVPEKVKAAP